MKMRCIPAMLLMGAATCACAINLPGGAPTQPETEQVRQRHERSTAMIVQGTVTKIDQAASILYVDGVPYFYHQFGTAPRGERAGREGRHGGRHEADGATADSAGAAPVEPVQGMRVSITVRKERSFNRARIIDLKQLGPEQNGN